MTRWTRYFRYGVQLELALLLLTVVVLISLFWWIW
jgi:hypothetical protein